MTEEEKLYLKVSDGISGIIKSQMFGKPCLKIRGKAFASFFEGQMVFKLNGSEHSNALKLSGAKLFDPSGKGRPMKEWVQVPFSHSEKWFAMADAACKYVSAE